jgi:autotransporter-associated beta strand protein
MTGGNAAGTSSFNSGTNWDDGLPPTAGNTYRTAGYLLRTPEGTSSYVFAGDRLTINSTGVMAWKSIGPVTVADLVLEGTIGHWYGNLAEDAQLFGAVTIPAGALARFDCSQTENDKRVFRIYAPLSGSGNLQVTMGHSNALKQVSLFADNSAFTGRSILRGFHKFHFCREEALGAAPAVFTANQMELSGATLLATNSLTLDDPTRGITLNNTLNAGSQIYPGGGFEVTGANTATVACVIAGAGPFTKRGTGTLVLATNNTYTGLTTVQAGTLWLATNALPASASVEATGTTAVVAGGGALSNLTLTAGGRLAAEKGGWDIQNLSVLNTTNVSFALDLSAADPATALIRVSGTLSKLPLQVFHFVVNTNNTTAVPYKVLSAPGLGAFADADFCVTPPWIGEFSRADDGQGGQVLLFTPTRPEDIAFKVGTDVLGDSGFTNALWSTQAPPVPEKTYVYRAGSLRTPASGSVTFPGKRLVVDGMSLGLKGPTGLPTITNLVMMNDASFSMSEGVGSRMAGDILLHPVRDVNRAYAMRVSGASSKRNLDLYSALAGYGDLLLQATGDPAYGPTIHTLYADSTNFYGKIRVDGITSFWVRVASEQKLGGTPPLFRADQLIFNGGGLGATNDVTLDDANRGITLLANGGTFIGNADPGSYPLNSTNRYEGGGTFRPESNTVTLTVSCPITGAGTLIKNGAGRLVLGGSNTYTGQTEIVAGALEPVSTNALGKGPLLVRPEGRLVRRYPGPALPNGVELGSTVTFEAGAQIVVEPEAGHTVSGNFTVPLFSVPSSVPVDPASVPVQHGLPNYKATVTATTAGGRTVVSVQLAFQGSMMMIK